MSFARRAQDLIAKLPLVRGRYTPFAPIGETSWFRVGGVAEVLYKPADRDDLAQFLAACPDDVPITVLGVCSNVIIRDGGIPGVVIRMGRGFTDIEQEDKDVIYAGASVLDMNLSLTAQKMGIAGLEFYSGIPGTIGGAIRMNAGAYGSETVDVLVEAEVIDRDGQLHRIKPNEDRMMMRYRHNSIPENFIFVGGYFKGEIGDPARIEAGISMVKERRAASQPIKARTGGSTFANPSAEEFANAGLPEDHRAWKLIDAVGGRSLEIGGAQMSEKHCNFMINTGNASAADLESLGEEMRRRVFEEFGIKLRWEIKRLGLMREDLPLTPDTQTLGAAE